MNQERKQQYLFAKLLTIILLIAFFKGFGQTCDPYIQKALEQTHITTLPKVSYGAVAEFIH